MSQSPSAATARLLDAADDGTLARLCHQAEVDLFVLFGSAAALATPGATDRGPGDVDVAVRFAPAAAHDVLRVLDSLYELTGGECFDVLDLTRAFPVARDRALAGGLPLYQAVSGNYANAQIAAMLERMETEHFRRMELEFLL